MSQELDAIQANVKAMVTKFLEHNLVNGIRVFVTVDGGDRIEVFNWGGGDCYSTRAYIQDWVETARERARAEVRRDEVD